MSIEKRTVTAARLKANRAAAACSTGPRTEEGKQHSAANSFRHGLYATREPSLRQAMSRAGHDPADYDRLHRALVEDWQPEDVRQELLVEDLAWLYWLKRVHQRAQTEWLARQAEHFRIDRGIVRNEKERERGTDHGRGPRGWRGADPGQLKFENVFACLDDLESRANKADWKPEEVKSILTNLYSLSPNGSGRRLQQLFARCARQHARPSDAAVSEIKECIREERANAREEQRLWQQQEALEDTAPINCNDPLLHPVSSEWDAMERQEERTDRQINAKIRLLMHLQAASRAGNSETTRPAGVAAVGQGFNPASPDRGPFHRGKSALPGAPSTGSVAARRAPTTESLRPAEAAAAGRKNTKNDGTKPNRPLESTKECSVDLHAGTPGTVPANGQPPPDGASETEGA